LARVGQRELLELFKVEMVLTLYFQQLLQPVAAVVVEQEEMVAQVDQVVVVVEVETLVLHLHQVKVMLAEQVGLLLEQMLLAAVAVALLVLLAVLVLAARVEQVGQDQALH
jgi:hypothetical protein